MAYNHFENGVTKYIHGIAVVDVYFPCDSKGNADCSCNQCKFYQSTSRRCALTHEISEYPMHYVGSHCPLQFETDEE